jgi:acetyl-CoA synthetase
VLKSYGVKRGDTVSVYLPMTWHAVAAFLACARIGAIHSVVFAGFSSESLRDRVQDCRCRVVITSDEGRRGGKSIATKAIVDAALKECPLVEHVLVLKRTGNKVPWTEGRDKWWHEEAQKVPNYCPPEVMASEDPLFILYVSRCLPPHELYLPSIFRLPARQASPRASYTPREDIFSVQR